MPEWCEFSNPVAERETFERYGWEFVRQRGSHMILVKTESAATLSVPDHKEVARHSTIPPGKRSWDPREST